jgi:hypothetical protein
MAFHWKLKILKSSSIALSISYGFLTVMLIRSPVELHGDGGDFDEGAALGRPEAEDAKNMLSAEVAEDEDE